MIEPENLPIMSNEMLRNQLYWNTKMLEIALKHSEVLQDLDDSSVHIMEHIFKATGIQPELRPTKWLSRACARVMTLEDEIKVIKEEILRRVPQPNHVEDPLEMV